MYGIIYLATNTINNKVYIGQTIYSLKKRSLEHKSDSSNAKRIKYHFQNAIIKYGFDKFTFEEIDTCISQEDMDEKERYWIKYYNSTDRDFGYNISHGGNPGKELSRLVSTKLWLSQEFRDKMKLATQNRKPKNDKEIKLTREQVAILKGAYNAGISPTCVCAVAKELYGSSASTIQAFLYNGAWDNVDPLEYKNCPEYIKDKFTIEINQFYKTKTINATKRMAHKRKLSDLEISEIKYLKQFAPAHLLANIYNVSGSLISKIFSGKRFSYVNAIKKDDWNKDKLDNIEKIINKHSEKILKILRDSIERAKKLNNYN